MNRYIQIRVRRWYFVAVFRVPGVAEPACLGFGLDESRDGARREAEALATAMVSA